MHSALTGHLLLSSLHTNDAATTVPRLIDMKIAPFLIAAVLNVVIAQRLIRKICLNCIESYIPDDATVEFLKNQLKEFNPYSEIKISKFFYRGRGCQACNNTGYRGRIGVYEVININEEIRKIIIDPNFSLDNLNELAKKNGMITMFEDGLRKIAVGMTTMEEVIRVIRE